MGTRGFLGFVVDSRELIQYNHFDSYPEGLGAQVLGFLRDVAENNATRNLRDEARLLRVVRQGIDEPTETDIENLKPWTSLTVGEQSTAHWYNLLRETQGDPDAILTCGYIEDGSDFPGDSLFAEWGYVIDLDAETFEVYRGFQHEPHNKGRFAERVPREGRSSSFFSGGHYYPVALVASWPLADLPDEETFLATFRSNEDE